MSFLKFVFVLCFSVSSLICSAGTADDDRLPFQQLSLNDMSAFRPTTANWQIAGNAFADRNVPQMLEGMPGKGVLVNVSDPANRGHLFTKLEHGDIEIELDVMMAKESNSGIYFQGRYELQLQDSWGKRDHMKYGDIGGIYQRTDTVKNIGYEGSAPRVNASKAPGLWQHLRAVFQAPRFDAQGIKITNAKFLKVYLNGSLVQENFEVTGPTRSAGFKDEKAFGPIMIQGNHGRVAFRNIGYKLYNGNPLKILGLQVREFKSPGDSIKNRVFQATGTAVSTDSISYLSAREKEINLLEFSGRLNFITAGDYLFQMQNGGGGMLIIDKDTILVNDGVHNFDDKAIGRYRAQRGDVPFKLIHNKLIGWRKGLAFAVEGPGIALHALNAPGSVFYEPPVEPILLEPDYNAAVIQRSFIQDGNKKRTHCLSVGVKNGPNYTVDLETGELFQMWDGSFLETTSMWHRRGNQQIGVPLGTVIGLQDVLAFKIVGQNGAAAGMPQQAHFEQYDIDRKGLPSFLYQSGTATVADKIVPSSTERSLSRSLKVSGKDDFTFKVAGGEGIEQLPDGSFSVDNKNYYLIFDKNGPRPSLRSVGGKQEIVLPIKGGVPSVIQYTLLW